MTGLGKHKITAQCRLWVLCTPSLLTKQVVPSRDIHQWPLYAYQIVILNNEQVKYKSSYCSDCRISSPVTTTL
ncbi:MAG: hypothetical protein RIQ94_1929 [Pseudomonadota bacterium]